MGSLRRKMLDIMNLCGLSDSTQAMYLRSVEKLARHYNWRPDELGRAEVQRYLLHLIEDRAVAHSTSNCAVAGLRLFYQKVLGRTDVHLWIPCRRAPQKLPDVLNNEELARLFGAAAMPKHRALLMTAYSGGLRVSEVVHLQLSDIDSERMLIHVRQGKGKKDRYTVLSQRLLKELREYWRLERPPVWLFPGVSRARPMVTPAQMTGATRPAAASSSPMTMPVMTKIHAPLGTNAKTLSASARNWPVTVRRTGTAGHSRMGTSATALSSATPGPCLSSAWWTRRRW